MTTPDRTPREVTVQYVQSEPSVSWQAPWAHVADGCLQWGTFGDPSATTGMHTSLVFRWSIRDAPRPSVVTMDLLGPYPSEEDV
jgi:hypothetical protein